MKYLSGKTYEMNICDSCHDRYSFGDEMSGTAYFTDFESCDMCGNFTRANYTALVEIDDIRETPCNCGEHIRHNNGGNYHPTCWDGVFITEVKERYL